MARLCCLNFQLCLHRFVLCIKLGKKLLIKDIGLLSSHSCVEVWLCALHLVVKGELRYQEDLVVFLYNI